MEVREAFDIGRAISHGIEALKRQPLGLLLGSFLMTCTDSGGGGGGNFTPPTGEGTDFDFGRDTGVLSPQLQDGLPALGQAVPDIGALEPAVVLVGLLCIGAVVLVMFAFRCFIEPGYLLLHRELAQTGQSDLTTLFSGAPHMLRVALWKILSFVVQMGVIAMAFIPPAVVGLGLYYADVGWRIAAGAAGVLLVFVTIPALVYVALGLVLGIYATVLDGSSPLDALERSWSLARGNRIHLFLYFLVLGFFHAAGLLLCCVGILFTRAIKDFGVTESYLLLDHDLSDLGLLR